MFIRTQDRQKLISDSALKSIKIDNKGSVLGISNKLSIHSLGSYKNNNRSMEILNEMQRAIQADYQNILSDSKILNYDSGVYIMPKE
jgi:hypothetical protein